MAKKSTKAMMHTRIQAVQEMLLEGRSRSFVLAYASSKWNIETRQADEYIKIATDQIDELNAATAQNCLAVITSNLWGLYRRYIKKEPDAARTILLDIAKLRGLDKIQVNVQIDRPLQDLSDEELAKVLSEAS